MDDKKRQLAFNIIDFLRTSVKDGTIKEDDGESMEVAVQCISEAFSIDPDSPAEASKYDIKPATLSSIFDVFLRTKERAAATAAASSSSTSAPAASTPAAAPVEKKVASDADKKKAEGLKAEGNALMSKKPKPDHLGAIAKYTDAIKLDELNPVFYSNRAAAYGARGEHDKAIEDAEEAVKIDPEFAKGWSRLGHAHYSLGDYNPSIRAYRKGLQVDPTNKNMLEAIKTARQKLKEEGGKEVNSDAEDEEDDVDDLDVAEGSRGPAGGAGGMPDLSALAGMFGGGGGGGGGMPDIAAMMQNPALMQMAQNMMANGGLESLMSNPAIRQMAERMGGAGGAGGAGR